TCGRFYLDYIIMKCLLAKFFLCTAVSLQGANEQRLYKDLLMSYNPLVRPVDNDSQILTVELGLSLMQILDVDEKNKILTTNIWLKMNWNDSYLQWNQSEYPGVSNMRFPYKLIWKPDIMLYNSADERFDVASPTNIITDPTGLCFYVPPGIFKSTCEINMRWFPFDVQRCELKFGSWTYGGWSLDLKLLDADTSDYIPNGEWDLVEVQGKKNERVYACCPEPYPDITFTLVMRRRTLFYGLNLLIPCVVMSTLALFVFLLPAESKEKISLGITVLLSLAVLMLVVADIMPATSGSVPLMAQFLATTILIVALSVIATVVVLRYHHHDPDGSKMPKWTRIILLNWCAWFLRMKPPSEERVRSACHAKGTRGSTDISAGTSGPTPTNSNMLYVGIRSLDNIYHSTAATSPDSGVVSGRLVGLAGEDEMLHPAGQSSSVKTTEKELLSILDEVRNISKFLRVKDENESLCNEWKFAASVIDRLCLVAFSLMTIFCTTGILMSAPNFVEAISKDLLS
uniref:Neuronal acetylcholine receptor subunit alpha-7-like n=1 Tax=Echeneis naucrates TaxID=173247 RepID=A0A665UZH1_ECHNA